MLAWSKRGLPFGSRGMKEKPKQCDGKHIQIVRHGRAADADVYLPDAEKYPVAVLSHGFGGGREDFAETAAFLAENGIGAVTFTFCGSGARDKSGFPTTEMTLFTEREDLLAVADYAKTLAGFDGRLFLVGGSMGGMVSAMAAESRPEDMSGLALLFPAFCIPDDWNARFPDDAGLSGTFELWGVVLGKGFLLALRGLDIYKNMPRITAPVLLFHGTEDAVVPLSYSERAAKAYPHAELVTYKGEGHGFSPPTMRSVEARLLAFIKENI